MFLKRLIVQSIMLAGPVLFFLLNQLACIPLRTALIFGIPLSAAGWVYGAIALRCPFCHHAISMRGFYIDRCPWCGEKL